MYSVYVLYSNTYNKTYVGFTSDLSNRLIAHNHPKNKGWTKRYRPWEILFFEKFSTKHEAMIREKQLKTQKGRAYIKQQISSVGSYPLANGRRFESGSRN